MSKDYDSILKILEGGTIEQFQELAGLVAAFPDGIDDCLQRRWIINAIDCGSMLSIAWMLSRKVDLEFCDDEGYTPLLSALECRRPEDRYEVLELLLKHGAPTDVHGINDWTPAHMAAVRNDVRALAMLLAYGANLDIRTRIDSYATPLEEARLHQGTNDAVRFLESLPGRSA